MFFTSIVGTAVVTKNTFFTVYINNKMNIHIPNESVVNKKKKL